MFPRCCVVSVSWIKSNISQCWREEMLGMWREVIRVIKHGSNTLEHLQNLSQQYLDHDHQSLIMSHSRIIALIRHCLIFFSYSWSVSVVSVSAQVSSDIRFQMKCFTVFASQSPGSYSPLHPFNSGTCLAGGQHLQATACC